MEVKDEAKGMSVTAQNAMLELAINCESSIQMIETGSSYKELAKQYGQKSFPLGKIKDDGNDGQK